MPRTVTPAPVRASIPPAPQRVAMLSVHTSPVDQPGTGDGGGLNVYVREISSRLVRRGVEVDLYTRWTDPGEAPSEELAPGLTLHRLEAGPVAPLPKNEQANQLCSFFMSFVRHPTAGTHDLLHGHYWLAGWVGARAADRYGIPLVQTFHTYGALKNATLAPGDVPEPPLRLHAEQRIARQADHVLAMTCGEARLLHRTFGLSGRNIAVVPAGVDTDVFDPDGPRAERDGDAPLLLFVGRLQPLKGPDVAVRILADVHDTHPGARLLVVGGASGSGQDHTTPAQLRELAGRLGVGDRVTIVPAVPQEELATLYRAADVVLVPSRSETFGLVALEAQACGTPVVAADVSGLVATVRGGGVRVAGHDPRDHAAAVRSLLDDPRRYREKAAAGIETGRMSSWDHTVDKLLDVYATAVDTRTNLARAS